MFVATIIANFVRFQYFNFETNFLKKKTFFKKLEYSFLVERTKIEMEYFYKKLPFQKAMLRRIEWGVKN